MITWLYYLLIAYITGVVIWNLARSKKWEDELLYVIVLIPFVLRLLGLK